MLPNMDILWKEEPKMEERHVLALFIGIRNSTDPSEWGYPPTTLAQIIQTFHRGMVRLIESFPNPRSHSITGEGISALFDASTPVEVKKILEHLPDLFDLVKAINQKIHSQYALKLGIGAEWGTVLQLKYPEQTDPAFVGIPLIHASRHVAISHRSYPLPRGGKLIIKEIVFGKALCDQLGIVVKNLPNLLFGQDFTLDEIPHLLK